MGETRDSEFVTKVVELVFNIDLSKTRPAGTPLLKKKEALKSTHSETRNEKENSKTTKLSADAPEFAPKTSDTEKKIYKEKSLEREGVSPAMFEKILAKTKETFSTHIDSIKDEISQLSKNVENIKKTVSQNSDKSTYNKQEIINILKKVVSDTNTNISNLGFENLNEILSKQMEKVDKSLTELMGVVNTKTNANPDWAFVTKKGQTKNDITLALRNNTSAFDFLKQKVENVLKNIPQKNDSFSINAEDKNEFLAVINTNKDIINEINTNITKNTSSIQEIKEIIKNLPNDIQNLHLMFKKLNDNINENILKKDKDFYNKMVDLSNFVKKNTERLEDKIETQFAIAVARIKNLSKKIRPAYEVSENVGFDTIDLTNPDNQDTELSYNDYEETQKMFMKRQLMSEEPAFPENSNLFT